MRAIAIRKGKFENEVRVREHRLTADEPEDIGGKDLGPSPEELLAAALASCTAITMQMYAERKHWDLTGAEVDCDYQPAERGRPTQFELILRLPESLSDEQVARLQVIAAKCPIHRTLEGEVAFGERVQRVAPV
ncbi:MAG: OsmC family protein [Solirubrobacteraceae bacterium]